METPLFTPAKPGPLLLRNRSIRAAAFEGMSPGHMVSNDLIDNHRAVSAGGVANTTVAYAPVSQSGLSFDHQEQGGDQVSFSLYTNKRKDEYSGSFENRIRFMREVVREVMTEAGAFFGRLFS